MHATRHQTLELIVICAALVAGATNLGWLMTPLSDATLLVPIACGALGLGQLFGGLLMLSPCSRGAGALCAAVAHSGAAFLSAATGNLAVAAMCLGLSAVSAVVAARRSQPASATRSHAMHRNAEGRARSRALGISSSQSIHTP